MLLCLVEIEVYLGYRTNWHNEKYFKVRKNPFSLSRIDGGFSNALKTNNIAVVIYRFLKGLTSICF